MCYRHPVPSGVSKPRLPRSHWRLHEKGAPKLRIKCICGAKSYMEQPKMDTSFYLFLALKIVAGGAK